MAKIKPSSCAVIYARYSSHSQSEQSIEGQLRDAYAWAEAHDITVVGEYIDRALSAKSDDRPDFRRMIEDSARRQFSLVIVWKLDRFARNRYDSAIYKAKLKRNGVRVVSVKENITDAPEGIILEGLLESMAEYYSANLSQNIKRGQRESTGKGLFCGGRVPTGFKNVNQHLFADEKKAPSVRAVFELYDSGEDAPQIRRTVRAKYGVDISENTIRKMLRNPVYIGKPLRNGQVVEGLADALIAEDLFERVQKRMDANAKAPAAAKAEEPYLLSGKAYCGHCGARLIGESGKGRHGGIFRYYTCPTRKKKHECDKHPEKKHFAECYVVDQTVEYVLTPNRMELIAAAVVEEYKKEFGGDQVADLERIIANLDKELDKLVDSIIELPKSAHKRIGEKMELLEAQKAELEVDLAKLRIAQRIALTEKDVLAWMRQFCAGDVSDAAYRQRIIDVFIQSVYFYDNRVVIFYNIKGGKQVNYVDLVDAIDEDSEETKKSEPCGSDSWLNGGAFHSKTEPRFIFINGCFGVLFDRYEESPL